jgi:hypothetical protein
MADGRNYDNMPPEEEISTEQLLREGIITPADIEEAEKQFGAYDFGVGGEAKTDANASLIDDMFRSSPDQALRVLDEALHWSFEKRLQFAQELRQELEEDAMQMEDSERRLEELDTMDNDRILAFGRDLAILAQLTQES